MSNNCLMICIAHIFLMYEIFSYLDNGYLEKTISDGCNIITALLVAMSLALAINFAFGISKIGTYVHI